MIRSYTMMKTGSTTGTVCHQGKRIKPDHGPMPEDHDPRKLPLGKPGCPGLHPRPPERTRPPTRPPLQVRPPAGLPAPPPDPPLPGDRVNGACGVACAIGLRPTVDPVARSQDQATIGAGRPAKPRPPTTPGNPRTRQPPPLQPRADTGKHLALDKDAMRQLLTRGGVSIVDLSGTDSATELNNIVIADLLRRIQVAQDDAYKWWEEHEHEGEFRRVLIVIEEAHEFLSKDRIVKLDNLYQQVARIARRGRKRWLGLVFVTQLPQHLPREVLGLVNNFVLHKINDDTVIRTLKDVIPGIDAGLWRRLPALAPGQAIASFTHMTRPLLIAVDPSGCRLRMVD